jgi:hypothetical protein
MCSLRHILLTFNVCDRQIVQTHAGLYVFTTVVIARFMLVSCFSYALTLMMEATFSSETSAVTFNRLHDVIGGDALA